MKKDPPSKLNKKKFQIIMYIYILMTASIRFGDEDFYTIDEFDLSDSINKNITIRNNNINGGIVNRLGTNNTNTSFQVRGNDDLSILRVYGDHTCYVDTAQVIKQQSTLSLTTITANTNVTYDEFFILGGLILRDCNGVSRTDSIVAPDDVCANIPNVAIGMTFELLICNISGTGEDITLANNGLAIIVGINVIKAGYNTKFTGIIKNITQNTREYTLYSHGTDTSGGSSTITCNYQLYTPVEINQNSNYTYSATEWLSGIIIRNPNSNDVEDTICSASSLINQITNPVVGLTMTTEIFNISTKEVKKMFGGSSMTIVPSSLSGEGLKIKEEMVRTFKCVITGLSPDTMKVYSFLSYMTI